MTRRAKVKVVGMPLSYRLRPLIPGKRGQPAVTDFAVMWGRVAEREVKALLAVARAAGDLSRLVYPPDVWTPDTRPRADLGPGEKAAKRLNAALRRLARASRGET